jgi:hypothetical protein
LRGQIGGDHRRADGIGLGSGRNPDSLTQYRINVRDPDRTLAIEDDVLVLTDADGAALMVKQKGEHRRVVTQQPQARFSADRFVKAAQERSEVLRRGGAHVIPNTAALVGPTEARPNLDPLPLCSKGDRASRSCAVLDGRLSRAAEFASISRGRVLQWSFFLLVRWCPPLRGNS